MNKMKIQNLKSKKSLLKGLFMGFFMTASLILLSSCGSKSAVSSSAGVTQSYQLSDDCALLHIYRPGSMVGMAVSYDLKLNDEVVFRVKNKSKTTIKITNEGMKKLTAKTEATSELSIDVKFGQEYYVQCGVEMGVVVGRPKLDIVDNTKGKSDFVKIP